MTRARRHLSRATWAIVRRAWIGLWLWPAMAAAQVSIISASYEGPTTRYGHAVLGDAIEHTTLRVELSDGTGVDFTLPLDLVFEDTVPRLVDLDGDNAPEIITVESSQSKGARLAIYSTKGRIAATPHIGTRFRWLAPVGAADLDGDGAIELAYVDRPHLAKTLRIWRFEHGDLIPVGDLPGVTNHRIGEEDIAGGIRTCSGHPEMVLASSNWSALVAIRYDEAGFDVTRIGSDTSRSAFANAMVCAD